MNSTNSILNITPEQVQTQINAWTVVAFAAGSTAWHLVLKAIPAVKAVAPWARASGGLLRGARDFIWTKPWPADNLPLKTTPVAPAQPTKT